jgi:hypothetical protein
VIKFDDLLLVATAAVVVPLVLGLLPAVKVPAVVFETSTKHELIVIPGRPAKRSPTR